MTYTKTAAGLDEIRFSKRNLTRPQRNLLLVVNDCEPIDFWLSRLNGIYEKDVLLMVELGLIEASKGRSAAGSATLALQRAPLKPVEQDSEISELSVLVDSADFPVLFEALVKKAHAHAGSEKGYQFELELQNCETLEALRLAARVFILQIQTERAYLSL